MLKKVIKEIFSRIIIIIALVTLIHILSYREGLKTYNSYTMSVGDIEIIDLTEGFSSFIHRESLDDELKDFSDINTIGRVRFASINVDLPIQYTKNISKLNNVDYWGNVNGFGIIRTNSNEESFNSGITYVEGNNYNQHMFAKLKAYNNEDFLLKNDVFVLESKDGSIKPYIVFSVTNASIKEIMKDSVFDTYVALKDSSMFEVEAPSKVTDIAILAVVSDGNDILLIGGYYR